MLYFKLNYNQRILKLKNENLRAVGNNSAVTHNKKILILNCSTPKGMKVCLILILNSFINKILKTHVHLSIHCFIPACHIQGCGATSPM